MKPLNRIKVTIIAILLIVVAMNVIGSNTRLITDTSDSYGTLIRNSNGNYWNATDDDLQLAIWDLNSSEGGTIWIPEGVIACDKEIWFNDDYVEIIGAGEASYLKLDTDLPALLRINGSSTSDVASRIKIKNINFVNSGTYRGSYMHLKYCSMIDIEDCEFQSSIDEAILLQTVWAPTIEGCYFKYCGNKTYLKPAINFTYAGTDKSTSITIENNLFEYNEWIDIYNNDTLAYQSHHQLFYWHLRIQSF